jgi:hypothetical protein
MTKMEKAIIAMINTSTLESNELFNEGLSLSKQGFSHPRYVEHQGEVIIVVSKNLNIDLKKALLYKHMKLMKISKHYDLRGDTLLVNYILDTQENGNVIEIDGKKVEIKLIS